jgi:DNA-binding response OmpR family regulator
VLIALRRGVQVQLVRDDQAGVQLVAVNQVAQLPVVLLDVGLPGTHRLALERRTCRSRRRHTTLAALRRD